MNTKLAFGWLAAAALAACSDEPERVDVQQQSLSGVQLVWHVPGQKPFVSVVPRSDGSALATTHDDVFSIDPTGAVTVVHDGPPPPQGPRPIIAEGSDGFLVPSKERVSVHDASGALKTEVPLGLNEYARFVPGSLKTFVPSVESPDPEHGRVLAARVFDESGAQSFAFETKDLVKSELTAGHLVWATRTELTKSTLDGSKIWKLPIRVQKLEASADAKRLIVNRGGDTRVVELYDESKKIGASTFEAPLWNIAIAPNGKFAAASSRSTLRIFENGKQIASMALGDVYPVSLDVADDGSVLLGTQTRKEPSSAVRLFDPGGDELWSKPFASDRNAHRPDVTFTPDGKGFSVRDAAGISFFAREGL